MIPVLYSETERDYGHGGIGVLTDTMNYLVTEEANGEFELYLEYPVQGAMFTELKNNRLIRAKPNDLDDDHVFRIYEVVKDLERQTVYIYATSISNDLGTNMVSYVKITSKTAQESLNMLKANLIEPTHFNFVSDITTTSSTEWEFRNPLNCIVGEDGSLVKYWGGEVKRTNDTVYLYARRGRDNVAVLREGKNLEGLEMTISTKGIVTKILPYMTRYDDATGEERLIVGNIVTSPLVDNYPVKSIKAVDYTMYDDIDTVAELNTLAGGYFTYQNPGIDKPKVSIDIDIMQLADSPLYSQYSKLESLGLFDSVSVYIPRFDVSVIVKVNKIEYNGLLERAEKIQCGDPVGNIFDDVKAGYTNMIVETEAKITNIVQKAANGTSTIFRGTSEPANGVKTGDLWYKPIGEFEIEMYQWNGMEWELILSTQELNMYRPLVEAAIEAAEQAKLDAEQAYTDAVAEADRLVTAETTRVDAIIETVNADILNVKNNADSALASIDTAIANAGFTSLDATLANITSIGNQAKADASTALSQAQSAVAVAGGVSGRVTTVENSVDSINGVLVNKVSTVDFNALTGRVGIAETAITQHDTAISLRATKTELTTAIDGIEVGGRNLVKNTAMTTAWGAYSYIVTSALTAEGTKVTWGTNLGKSAIQSEIPSDLVNGEKYILRLKARGTLNIFQAYILTTPLPNYPFYSATGALNATNFREFTVSFTYNHANKSNFLFLGGTPSASGQWLEIMKGSVKLEKGNKATDWTPAPEDVDASIAVVQSNLSVEAGKISAVTARVSGTESSIASVKQTADGNSATVASHTGQISTINQTVSGLQSTVASKAAQSQVTQLANGLSSVVTDLSNLEVGGRNYFTKTTAIDQLVPNISFTPRHPDSPNGFSVMGNSMGNGGIRIPKVITGNGWWTISFDIKGGQSLAVGMTVDICDLGATRVYTNTTNTYERRSVSVNVTNYTADVLNFVDFASIQYAYFWVDNIKVEKGNKATDWTPAPEDMAAKSQITQLSNLINLRVTSGDVTAAILADKRIKDTRTTNPLPSWYFTNYSLQRVEEFKGREAIGVPGASTYVKLVTDVPWSDPSGGVIVQTAYSSDGVYNRSGNAAGTAWGVWVKQTDSANVLAQVNLSTEGVLIQGKRIQLDGDVTMTAAYVTKLNTQTITAVNANIASIRTSILTADVITSGMVATSTALIDKVFATEAMVTTLTGKAAFINNIKAITISADKITAGTLNAANVNIINLNADRIASGTVSGANSAWNLNTGRMNFKNPSTNDDLIFTQGQIEFTRGAQTRLLKYNAEGLVIEPMSTNTGTSLNTSIHLNGGVDYIQFNNRLGTTKFGRLEIGSNNAKLEIPVGVEFGIVDVNNVQAPITANYFKTVHNSGQIIYMQQNRIYTVHDHLARNIYLEPNGVGSVVVGDGEGTRWNIVASDFVKQSTRESKIDISPIVKKGLDVINRLVPVRYKKKDKVAQGIIETELGFIAEDSPEVASPDGQGIYDSHITAYLVKGVQEMDLEIKQLKQKIAELERNIA